MALLGLALIPVLQSEVAEAQRPPLEIRPDLSEKSVRPRHRLDMAHVLLGRANPGGAAYALRLAYQLRLFTSDEPILNESYVSLGVLGTFTPAFLQGGLLLEVQPVSLFKLWASFEGASYFGGLDLFQSFPGPASEHDDDTLANPIEGARGAYGTSGTRLTLGAQAQVRIEGAVLRNASRLVQSNFDVSAGDTTFYDPIFDVLAPNEGWLWVNDLDALWVTTFGLAVGGRWTVTHALYEGDVDNPNTPHHRFGPVIVYTFWDEGGTTVFDRPSVFLVTAWWLDHRYRTGVEVDQGLPNILFGVSFNGDLLSL